MQTIVTIDLDIATSLFQVHGIDGKAMVNKIHRLSHQCNRVRN
jgi:hypothetical protein